MSITNTKATRYEIVGIEDMVPTLWSPIKYGYNKDVEKGIKHWGDRPQLCVSVKKLHGYGHLDEIVMKRADRHLYKFKEGDFVDLYLNDIEEMLLLAVQHKLFHLDGSDIVDFIVALQIEFNELYTPSYKPPGVIYEDDEVYFAFGRHLDELHVTWAHLEKKRMRIQTNTKTLEDLCSQSLETTSQAIHDAVMTHQGTAAHISRRRDENPICTLGDYSKPSHEGYRNTIELPAGNNVVPLRSDTIRLVHNGCSFHGLWSEDPNQHLKDFLKLVDSLDLDGENRKRTRLRLFQFSLRNQASNWLERLPAGSISTWEDLTT
ncbi:hypothetical protein Tco_1321125 [Tanacetum coccineum]